MTDDPIVRILHNEIVRLMKAGASREEIQAEIDAARSVIAEDSTRDPERKRDINDAIGAVAQTALDAMTFGGAGILEDALTKGSFRENRDMRAANKAALPARVAIPAAMVGGILNPVGSVLGPAKLGAGALKAALRGLGEGAIQAGAAGVGENIGTTADPFGLKHGGAGVMFGAPFGAVGGAVGRSRALSRARTAGFANETESASRRASAALDADKSYTVPVLPRGPGAPKATALDVSGPTMQREANKAAQSIPGRQVFVTKFTERDAQRAKSIEEAFDHATGTTAKDADAFVRDLADIERVRDAANATQKAEYDQLVTMLKRAHSNAVAAAKVKPKPTTTSEALDVLRQESGGNIPDAVDVLRAVKEGRGARAAADYPAAIAATKGQAVPLTKEAEAFLKSPTGQAAWKAVQRNRGDVVAADPSRALPEVVQGTQQTPGFMPTALGPNSVLAKPQTEVVPDAEAWHEIKRYVQDAAKLGAGEATPEGVQAIHANNAMGLLDTVIAQQDDMFRAADLPYAASSAEMEATRLGMTPTKGNPPSKRALTRSLSAVEDRVSALPENEADLFRLGKQFDIASRLRAGLSPQRAAKLLDEPTSDLSREITLAYGPGAPRRISARLRTPDATVGPGPFVKPPAPSEIPRMQHTDAALAGLGIRTTPTAPSPAKPGRSLAELEAWAKGLMPDSKTQLRRGASTAFRDDLAGGKALGLDTPERARQFAFATKAPGDVGQVRAVEEAWNDIGGRQKAVLSGNTKLPPGEETVGDVATESIAASVPYMIARGARSVLRHPSKAKVERLGKADAAFAKLLTDDPQALQDALRQLRLVDTSAGEQAAKSSALIGRLGGRLSNLFYP
jgi:hypothetical protein